MRLESARDLKAELIANARTDFVLAREVVGRRPAAFRTAVRHGRLVGYSKGKLALPASPVRVPVVLPRSIVAFGIAPTPRANDFSLAVRVYAGNEQAAARFLAKRRLPEAEVDLATGVSYRSRALRPGGSCGHFRITAGTLGGFVEDANGYYVLSNNHVIANSDNCAIGDPVLQPGPLDIKRNAFSVIANLSAWVPLGFGAGKVDAAIAGLADDVSSFYPWRYTGIGSIKRKPATDRFGTRRVTKRGRTTGVTRGTVSAFDLDGVAIDYSENEDGTKVVSFDNQLEFVGSPRTKPFSQPGDSGSLIIDRDSLHAYALLYGGGPDDRGIDRTLGHFLPDVLDELGVTLVK